jgi:hypothetical protein
VAGKVPCCPPSSQSPALGGRQPIVAYAGVNGAEESGRRITISMSCFPTVVQKIGAPNDVDPFRSLFWAGNMLLFRLTRHRNVVLVRPDEEMDSSHFEEVAF